MLATSVAPEAPSAENTAEPPTWSRMVVTAPPNSAPVAGSPTRSARHGSSATATPSSAETKRRPIATACGASPSRRVGLVGKLGGSVIRRL